LPSSNQPATDVVTEQPSGDIVQPPPQPSGSCVAQPPPQPSGSGAVETPSQPSDSDIVQPPSQPTQDRSLGRPKTTTPALRRRPTKTASAASLSRTLLSTPRPRVCLIRHVPVHFSHILCQNVEQGPLKFFDPLIDMGAAKQPVESVPGSSTRTDTSLTDRSEAAQPHPSTSTFPVQSAFPHSSLTGLGPLPPHRRPNGAGPSLLRELPRAQGFCPNPNTPFTAAGGTWLYRQPSHEHLQRQDPLPRPPPSPTNSQFSGTAAASAAIEWKRRNSSEDTEAQLGILFVRFVSSSPLMSSISVLQTLEGDSLSEDNIKAYVNFLRKAGSLGNKE
jgi:hypothetical protein